MVTKAFVKDGMLQFRRAFFKHEIPVDQIVWAYLQREDVSARMCCGRASFEIGRAIVIDASGRREVFQYEGMDEPQKLIDDLHAANGSIAIGYTDENRALFGATQS